MTLPITDAVHRRWTDTTPRQSITDCLDALVREHAAELLACHTVELHVQVVDTEPPTQAIYDVQGSLGGRWVIALSFSERTSHLPVEECGGCNGTGRRRWRDGEADCFNCYGFGRVPVRLAVLFDVQGDQARSVVRRRDRANEQPSPVGHGFTRSNTPTLNAVDVPAEIHQPWTGDRR